METTSLKPEVPLAFPPAVMFELQKAADDAAKGMRDHTVMQQACDRMDRMRKETFRLHGLLDIGVPAIRELRDCE